MYLKNKFSFSQLFIVLILFVLTFSSCRTNSPRTKVNTPTAASVIPTSTALPTVEPSPTSFSQFPLDGYLVIFNKDGDLYFQDENNLPVQLTHGGGAHSPTLSDDNKKIVFFRGEYSDMYSVNTDGTQEQQLLANLWLPEFLINSGIQAFIPQTHQILFNTYRCEMQENEPLMPLCARDISLVDADSGEINEILVPGPVSNYGNDGVFDASPDGKKILIVSSGHLDIYNVNGEVISRNIFTYTPSKPFELFPSIYWLPDSSGLIVGLPNSVNYSLGYDTASYTFWRYTLNDKVATQILLDPNPTLTYAQCNNIIYISPDGKWGLYDSEEAELYLWHLSDGHTQLYAHEACSQPAWSADSQYFIYGGTGNPYFLGSINKPPLLIEGIFMEWIDARHFLFANITDKNKPRTSVGEIVGDTILKYELEPYILIKPK